MDEEETYDLFIGFRQATNNSSYLNLLHGECLKFGIIILIEFSAVSINRYSNFARTEHMLCLQFSE